VEARWVNQAIPRHTLVVATVGAGGWRAARDFQLVVGGLNGLRAHGVHALAGDKLWRWNAESRWLIGRDFQHLLSLGGAAFWDAARAWGPGSGEGRWQHDIGFGLRLGFPRSALNRVARFDVAWPIMASGPGRREAVFSFGSSQAF
jgi:hemolysin activation/secretion protein